ncbi:MAG TPA: hypothetical protein VN616_05470 [Puia sp.]|nr:hypothetical protein [Puia sp.]
MNLLSNPRIGWSALSFVFVTTLFSCAKTASTQNNSNKPDSNSSPNTPPVPAKKWVVSTLAGSGRAGFADGDSSQAAFNNPQGIATDNQGNIYVGDVGNASIRKITPAGSVITYANNAISNPALAFGNIAGLAVDQQGGLYDIEYGIIRKTVSSTAMAVLAGQMLVGYQDGLGSAADFNLIINLAIDGNGNLFVPDYDTSNVFHLREVSPSGNVITLTLHDSTGVSGNGLPNYHYLYAVAVNPQGGFYITANGNNMIKKIDAQGNVTIFAGWGIGFANGPGSTASFGTITGLACDATGNLYVADATNNAIRMVTPAGTVSTIGGNGTPGYLDGDSTKAEFNNPFGIAVDKNGTVYVTDELNFRIRKLVNQ